MRWFVLLSSVVFLSGNSCAKAVSADPVFRSDNDSLENSYFENQQFNFCKDSHTLKTCLKMRSLVLLEDLTLKDAPIHLFRDSLILVKNEDATTGKLMLPYTVEELDESLPKDEEERDVALDKLISVSLGNFIKGRALQIRLPEFFFWNNWISDDEGRKRKGGGGAGWALLMGGGMMGALGLGAIAMLAGKALMVSMMALMLSALAAMRRSGGGGGHGGTTYEVINVPTGHGHRRNFVAQSRSLPVGVNLQEDEKTSKLVYSAYTEKANSTE